MKRLLPPGRIFPLARRATPSALSSPGRHAASGCGLDQLRPIERPSLATQSQFELASQPRTRATLREETTAVSRIPLPAESAALSYRPGSTRRLSWSRSLQQAGGSSHLYF